MLSRRGRISLFDFPNLFRHNLRGARKPEVERKGGNFSLDETTAPNATATDSSSRSASRQTPQRLSAALAMKALDPPPLETPIASLLRLH
ncbi:hypothetical protein MAMC_00155 [Methylacidimicrobium cyclopophantes]|uniref:Uncharacterized protein n=1 Tax=Methylacidimicrobium cyclopophantes TaxID=1041766 RepID=A0A5E6MA52_9BACT|nr:hypothetical protein [Methylacidimicrobium cyclopophantes]VVM04633.1 hypothetical protein MAMC_00155 [Methylacidimicrobium cyclopophantes]